MAARGTAPARRRTLLALVARSEAGARQWWLAAAPAAADDVRATLDASRLGLSVLTPRQAARQIAQCRLPQPLPLGPTARREIITEVANAARKQAALGPLEQLIASPGLVDHLAARFRRLRLDGVGPDDALNALRRTDGQRAGGVLARLYRDYLDKLERHRLFDEEGVTIQATERLNGSPFRMDRLVVDLPLGAAPIERRFVEALALQASEVVVSVGEAPHDDAPHAPGPWESLLEPAAETLRLGKEEARAAPRGLEQIRTRLFDDAAAPISDATGVAVIAGAGAHDTARRVARWVKQQLAGGQARPCDVLLAAPRLEASAARYAEALDEYGVPYATDAPPRLGSAPITGAVLDILKLARTDWRFDALLAVLGRHDLRSLRGDGPVEGFVSPTAAAEWFVRETQLPSGRRYLQRQAEALATRNDSADRLRRLAAAARHAVGVFEQLASALDALPHEATAIGWIDAIHSALTHLGADGLRAGGDALNRTAGDTLEEAAASLENLAHWRGRSPRLLRLGEIANLVQAWSTRLRLPVRGSAEGRVRLVDAATAIGMTPKHLVVIDADESAFAAADTGSAEESMRRFYELAALPTASLTIAYPALDESAQPLAPSPFVTDVERLFAPGSTRRDDAPLLGPIDPGRPPASRREERTTASVRAVVGDGDRLAAIGDARLLDRLAATQSRATGDAFGGWEGMLLGAAAHAELSERYGSEHLWSASQLELMATCPYKFFARQVLRLSPPGELVLGIDYRRRGSLMHDALAECLTQIRADLGPGRSLQELPCEELSERLAARIGALADIGKLPAHQAALLAIEARQATDWAARYADQQAAFDGLKRWDAMGRGLAPTLLEARFGPAAPADGAEDPHSVDRPFELRLPRGETIQLAGRIDRVDTATIGDQTLFAVIDYKTSRDYRSSREAIESGKQLQPVLYALAAKELFFDGAGVPVAAGYWALQNRGFVAPRESELPLVSFEEGRVSPSDEWGEVVQSVRDRCQQLVDSVRGGQFPMHNDDEHCGRLCEFRTICRVGQARSLGKLPPNPEGDTP